MVTSGTPAALEALLAKHIEPWSPFVYARLHKDFSGWVNSGRFALRPLGRSRNSFRPTVFGQFHRSQEGTLINVTVRLPSLFLPFAIGFSLLIPWVAGPRVSLINLISQAIESTRPLNEALFSFNEILLSAAFSLACLVLFVALAWAFFRTEESKAISALASIIYPNHELPREPT